MDRMKADKDIEIQRNDFLQKVEIWRNYQTEDREAK